jgi:hypothetical protein
MKVKIYILLLLLFGCVLTESHAQRRSAPPAETEEENYTESSCYGINANTNGGILSGGVFKKTKKIDTELWGHRQYRYLAVELVNVKHPKEASVTTGNGGRFTPGKANYFFVIRPQYGREIVLSSRNADEGISINAILAAGPSIGIVKPYYIMYQAKAGRILQEPYDPIKHVNPDAITGAGNFLQGIGDSKINMGVHVKAALNFELSAFRNTSTGLEIGFIGEFFTKKAPIIAVLSSSAEPNHASFSAAYITLFFGNRK